MRIHFDSTADYFHFVFAREFRTSDAEAKLFDGSVHPSLSGRIGVFLERVGGVLTAPILWTGDKLWQNKPIFCIVITAILIAAISYAIFPAATVAWLVSIAPFLAKIAPKIPQAAVFALGEATVLGVGLRALGRMSNIDLVKAWNNKEVFAVRFGSMDIYN